MANREERKRTEEDGEDMGRYRYIGLNRIGEEKVDKIKS